VVAAFGRFASAVCDRARLCPFSTGAVNFYIVRLPPAGNIRLSRCGAEEHERFCIYLLGQGEAMKSLTTTARSAGVDLFGHETVGFSTPIAEELQAHFERGGSVAEGVQLVAALERAIARRSAAESRSKQAAARGSRLLASWEPSQLDVRFALERGLPRTRLPLEAEKFRNYWTAKSGVSASKRDWSATWRNWVITQWSVLKMNGRDKNMEPSVLPEVRRLDRMPSLPAWVQQRIDALESECQPDNTGKYRLMVVLPRAMILNSSERAVVEERVADRASWLDVGQPITLDERTLSNDQAISVIIAELLINPRGSKLDDISSRALAEAYLIATDDLPAWSVRNALRKWIRGESAKFDGKPHDFDWRPAPATLRRLAQMELAPIKAEMVQLEKLLIAVPRLELSDEHRAKIRARFAELLKTLQAN
jgi:hypothetical protein